MGLVDFRIVRPVPITGTGSFTRASAGTFFDKDGVLQTAAADQLRLTYDPADLSKAPYALIEEVATNSIRNNTMQGAVVGQIGAGGAMPTHWLLSMSVTGIAASVVGVGTEDGIEYIDIRAQGLATNSGNVSIFLDGFPYNSVGAQGQDWVASAFTKLASGSLAGVTAQYFVIEEYGSSGYLSGQGYPRPTPTAAALRGQRIAVKRTTESPATTKVGSYIGITISSGSAVDFTLRIGLPQLERDQVTSPIKTTNAAVTRPADLIGTTAGLVYSNVPEVEPLWAAGTTYAKDAVVRDAAHLSYQSMIAGNVGQDLTDKAKWLPLGATNRWKAFDKGVYTQTTAPEVLTFVVKPGELANTLGLLNVEGARVTVSQTESDYSVSKSLVRHDVLSWYDFYYEEPIREGDVVFDGIPPYITSALTITVENPGGQAAIGACLMGKARFIGNTAWDFTGGILSYSGSEEDTFGNVTIVKRENAKILNFEVYIPKGFESEAYRILRQCTDVELLVIGSDQHSMGISYCYLGQWTVPVTNSGKTAHIEARGLI